ncbi:MAG: right-handed parallel beta-helix repeat-containing protein, partial [Planctomycetota bacterium]
DKLTVGSGGPATMFSDDFSDSVITGWTHASGEDTLSESSSALRATSASTNSHYTVDGGTGWTDYTVTCDIKSHDDDETGISFRAQDGNNYYLFYQNFGNPGGGQWELSLEKYVDGTPTDLATPIDHQGVVAEEVWYTLKVEVSGTSIKCYFDDVLKFDITDEAYSDGTVGAWCLSQECRWDNMLVQGTDDGIYHILSRDDDTTVTIQETVAAGRTDDTFKIERVYNTLQDWEDACDGDLVTEARREVGVCYNDGAFTSRLAVNDSTTDATHYMMLTVAEGQRHNGIAGAGARLDGGGGFSARPINVKDPYTRIEWLEITNWLDDHSGVYFDESPAEDNADNSSVSHLLLHNFFTGTSDSALHFRADNVTARNTIIYDGEGEGIRVRVGTGHVIDNCTIYGITGDGVYSLSGTGVTVRNTISVGNSSDDFDLAGTVDFSTTTCTTRFRAPRRAPTTRVRPRTRTACSSRSPRDRRICTSKRAGTAPGTPASTFRPSSRPTSTGKPESTPGTWGPTRPSSAAARPGSSPGRRSSRSPRRAGADRADRGRLVGRGRLSVPARLARLDGGERCARPAVAGFGSLSDRYEPGGIGDGADRGTTPSQEPDGSRRSRRGYRRIAGRRVQLVPAGLRNRPEPDCGSISGGRSDRLRRGRRRDHSQDHRWRGDVGRPDVRLGHRP